MRVLEQYLQHYALKAEETQFIEGSFDEVVVVPCLGEDSLVDDLLATLLSASGTQSVLVLLVVNETPLTPSHHRLSNQALLNRYATVQHLGSLTLVVLNRTGARAFEPGQGVGHARRLGCDVAVELFSQGTVKTNWVHTTDGDAKVALDYFNRTPKAPALYGLGPLRNGALIHPFHHEIRGPHAEALSLYDRFLRYYCEGLRFAGSPYAYPTVGSTLSFSVEAYVRVRGFPPREAAEDFYFLHKLAKTAFVQEGGGLVTLQSRDSDRVPFGTGRSIEKINNLLCEGRSYTVYDPAVFQHLKIWIEALGILASGASWKEGTRNLSALSRNILEKMGAHRQQDRIGSLPESGRLRHWHTWFDGFQTLKFIHELRSAGFPNLALEEALARFSHGF